MDHKHILYCTFLLLVTKPFSKITKLWYEVLVSQNKLVHLSSDWTPF